MRVWQTSLLPFDGVHPAACWAEDVALVDDVHELDELLSEYSCQQVVAVRMGLAG